MLGLVLYFSPNHLLCLERINGQYFFVWLAVPKRYLKKLFDKFLLCANVLVWRIYFVTSNPSMTVLGGYISIQISPIIFMGWTLRKIVSIPSFMLTIGIFGLTNNFCVLMYWYENWSLSRELGYGCLLQWRAPRISQSGKKLQGHLSSNP